MADNVENSETEIDEPIVEQKFAPIRCMGHCGKKFVPVARHNHVCPKCTDANAGISDRAYRVVRKYRE